MVSAFIPLLSLCAGEVYGITGIVDWFGNRLLLGYLHDQRTCSGLAAGIEESLLFFSGVLFFTVHPSLIKA
jgi:hypothetical protein